MAKCWRKLASGAVKANKEQYRMFFQNMLAYQSIVIHILDNTILTVAISASVSCQYL